MNESELARLMLDWEDLQLQADDLNQQIQDAVLKIGKSRTVGNVKASYRNKPLLCGVDAYVRVTIIKE